MATRSFLNDDPRHILHVAWCPGHEGVPGNERVDDIAKLATALPRHRGVPRATTSFLRRLNRGRLLTEWDNHVAGSDMSKLYRDTWTGPPTLKMAPHLRDNLSRRAVSLIVQIRTGHCFSGEYSLHQRHAAEASDVECWCGAVVQSRLHLLVDCPKYQTHRHILRKASPELDIRFLLGTAPGLAAVARFAGLSGAFTITGTDKMKLGELHRASYAGLLLDQASDVRALL